MTTKIYNENLHVQNFIFQKVLKSFINVERFSKLEFINIRLILNKNSLLSKWKSFDEYSILNPHEQSMKRKVKQ